MSHPSIRTNGGKMYRCTIRSMGTTCSLNQLGTSIGFHQKPKQGEGLSTGDFKRTVEPYVAIVCKAGGMFIFDTIYYEPFLTDAGETIATYATMNENNVDHSIFKSKISWWQY